MKISTIISGLMLFFTVSSGQAKTLIWSSASDGDWGASSNWSPPNVPGIGDIAIITNSGTFTVTLSADVTVDTLTLGATNGVGTQTVLLNGRALTVSGQGTVNFNGSLTGGTLAGNWVYSSASLSGALTLATNSVLNLVSDTASTIYLSNLVLTNHGTVNWSNVVLFANAISQVYNFGLWDAQANDTFSNSVGGNNFNNYGTFRKSGGLASSGNTYFNFDIAFNNYGTVDVQSGNAFLNQVLDDGIITIAPDAVFASSGCFLTGSPMFSGAGRVYGNFYGGNAVLNGVLNLTNATLGGTLTLASNSVLNLATPENSTAYFNGLTLTNYGMVNWSNVNLSASSTSQIENYGLWEAWGNDLFTGASSTTTFNNRGIFRKSAGFLTHVDYNVYFNNYPDGTVEVRNGTAYFSTITDGGTVNTVSNSMFSSAGCFLTGSPVFGGAGKVNGSFYGGNALMSGILNLTNATLGGTLTLASNSVLNLATPENSTAYFNGLTLTNYGTVNWSNVNLSASSTSQIENYGSWEAWGNDPFTGTSSATTFNNRGTFRKTAGFLTYVDSNISFNNWPEGTVEVRNGTAFFSTIADGGTVNVASNAMVSCGGCFLTGSPVFGGVGKVNGSFYGGNAVLNGVLNLTNATLGGTLTLASNAVMNLTNDMFATVNFNGLTLTNYGTINWAGVMLTASSSLQIENYGVWDDQQDDLMTGSSGITSFNNHSVFRKSAGFLTYVDSNISFNNWPEGTVEVQNGTAFFSTITDGGTVNTVSNSMFSSAGCFLTGSPVFGGAGKVNGSFYGGNALMSGILNLTNATLGGTLTLASNSVLNLATPENSTAYFNGLTLTNYGTVNWSNVNLSASSTSQIENYGLWEAWGNDLFTGTSDTTTFNNYGILRKSGGDVGSGSSYFDYNTVFNNYGTADMQVGSLNLGGNYSLAGGTLNFGISSPTIFGSINLGNNALLAGTISANLKNGYAPTNGSAFAVLSYGSATGAFTALNLPHLSGGWIWQTNAEATTFSLSITSAPPFQLTSSGLMQNGTNFGFSFGAIPGQIYQVQCTTNLAPANWINLGDPITASNSSVFVSDLIGTNLNRFYRVVLQ